jgi:hypothetical protein
LKRKGLRQPAANPFCILLPTCYHFCPVVVPAVPARAVSSSRPFTPILDQWLFCFPPGPNVTTPFSPDDPPDGEEPWEVARRWASRHQHVVFWLLVGLTFPLEVFCLVGVAASGTPLVAVVAVPVAFLPLIFMGFAVERTKKVIELRRLIVGKWRARSPEGEWWLQFTDNGTLIVNDMLTAGYVLCGNLELVVSSAEVRTILGERVVSLGESELILTLDGVVCRFTRAG